MGQNHTTTVFFNKMYHGIKSRIQFNFKILAHFFVFLALHTGKPVETITKDTDRDYFFSADEAKAYGLIDDVIEKRK